MTRTLLAAILATAAVACAPRLHAQTAASPATAEANAVLEVDDSLPSAGRDTAADDLLVREGDVLRVQVWPDSSLGGEFLIEETGYVYLPVLGRVDAGRRPLPELRAQLRAAYAEAIKTPVVTVTPVYRVSVLGAVQRPGLYEVEPSLTLFDVVSMAGGFAENAEEDEVRIVRSGGVIEVNAAQALETGEELEDLRLRSGDRIVVPEGGSWLSIRDFFDLARTAISVITLVNILQ